MPQKKKNAASQSYWLPMYPFNTRRPFELRESWAAALVPRYRPYFRLYHHHPRQSSLPFFPLKMRKHHISSSAERPKNSEKMPPGTCLQVEWDVKKSHWQANEHQLKVQYGMSTRKAAYFALSPAHAAPTSITICIAFPRAAFSFGEQAAGRKLRREVTTGSLFYHLPSNQNTIFDRPASKIFHLCTKIRFFEVPRKRSKFSASGKHDFPPAKFKLPLPSSWNLSSRGLSVILLTHAIPVLGDAVESTFHFWESGEKDFEFPPESKVPLPL
ncbi:hypothetical protein C8R43DRAFT_953624 [Mycena crocata]|nr:hypothetical protein C8R43DRAFT_953624 [Mycena crocata]